jgi:hypothetical protein
MTKRSAAFSTQWLVKWATIGTPNASAANSSARSHARPKWRSTKRRLGGTRSAAATSSL